MKAKSKRKLKEEQWIEYETRSVYRDLINKNYRLGKSTAALQERLNNLEEKKWGKGAPGLPRKRRVK